ncbi:uncharacterized protein LOC135836030 isoform X2 [Planococcus citri]|uniref:uncharacterized protein LOC135836030 isoform X2 n=1 Tax=Planococcus citri TaxID=170843 RepID=UPI0031F81F62
MDFRKEWFKHRILSYFEESQSDLFDIFLKNDNNSVPNQLHQFLDNETNNAVNINTQVFIVYKTYYSKIVNEEIEVQEEVTKQRTASFLSQDDKRKDKRGKKKKKSKKSKDIKEEEDDEVEEYIKPDDETSYNVDGVKFDDIDEDDKQKKKKSKKTGKSGGRISPYTMVENLPLEEQSVKPKGALAYITVKRKVEKVIQVPQFQGHFGIFNGDKFESTNYYVYFVKKMNCKIPLFSSMEEANEEMPTYITFGSITGNIFQNLEKIINLVFIPLFHHHCSSSNEDVKSVEYDEIGLQKRPSYFYLQKHVDNFNIMKDELSITPSDSVLYNQLQNFMKPEPEQEWKESYNQLVKLLDVVKWAQTQLYAGKLFEIPEIFYEFDWDTLDVTEEIIKNAKITLQNCIDEIESQYSDNLRYDPVNDNLMNEYEHWKNMEINLSTVLDELNSPLMNKISEIVKIHHASLFDSFETKRSTLYNDYLSVKENASLLQTLQYFFKILMYSNFESISNRIPTLMDSLQSIWILSDYYGQEKNMERILNNIKNTLCRRTKEAFDVTTLFKKLWSDMKDDVGYAVSMLQIWKNSYLEVRTRIESTRDHFVSRWEFNKQKLFSETDYISTVIEDIKVIFEVVQSFHCLFSSKFRKMAEKTVEFKNLEQKVSNLTLPIEKVDFDIYLEIFRDEWNEILEIFQQDVIEVDQRLKILIIKTFSQIKSIKEGIEVVQNISEIQTRPTVHESVSYMCNKIIAQFVKEIKLTDKLFEVSELLENFLTKAKNYKKKIFKEWCSIVVSLIKNILNENVIEIEEAEKVVDLNKLIEKPKINECTTEEKNSEIFTGNEALSTDRDVGFGALSITLKWIARSKIMAETALKKQRLEVLKQIEQAHKISWLEFVGDSLLIEKGFRFRMKFRNDIFEILKESENLRNYGFGLPNEITELLIIKNDLHQHTESINGILTRYNDILDKLQPAKTLLMKRYLLEVEMTIQPGLGLYTWKCTVLDKYVQKITTTLEELSCLLYQTNKIFKKLDTFIETIENLNFLPVKQITTKNIKCENFFHEIDSLQKREANKCVTIYNTISMTLIQIESLILFTSTGKSELMTYYYASYSDKIVSVLIKSVLNSIFDLNSLICGELPTYFHVKIFLRNNDVKLSPNCAELFQYMKIALTRAFSRLRNLKQWEPGSCLVGKNSAEMFYVRVILDQDVKVKCELLLQNIQNLCDALKTSTAKWLIYSILWEYDKKITIKQFADENPQLGDYEMRFDFYQNVASKIEQERLIVNVFCVNVETDELIQQLKNHCLEWKHNLGAQLTLDTRHCVHQIHRTIQKLNLSLIQEIKTESHLTEVLRTINEIQSTAFDMELQFYKIEEHYHELVMQDFTLSQADGQFFQKVYLDWQELFNKSLYKKFSLESVKNSITESMKQKILQFIETCRKFADRYAKEKPDFETVDFDSSVNFILDYNGKCEELFEEKQQLEIVQSCYEIAPFDFDFFLTIKNNLKTLQEEFKLVE